MPQRTFLGYDSPFLPLLTGHLLEDRAILAETLVITPTTQSGRILRESLAAEATALLAPTVTTPGALLHLDDPSVAPAWLERIAWIEVLESLTDSDWKNLTGLFPEPPDTTDNSSDWAISLASEITTLRTTLQDHLHNLFSASKFLTNTPEATRWENLATLENLTERKLSSWGYTSRSAALRADFTLPSNFQKIVLAGVTEMPPCLSGALEKFTGDVTCIIAAPESESAGFSPLGIPLEDWATRELSLSAEVQIAADPAQQAQAALDAISQSGAPSSKIALGSADDQTGTVLARTISEDGWSAFHPAAAQPLPALVRWLQAWKNWLSNPSSTNLAALLTLPESTPLIGGLRARKLRDLNSLRDNNPTTSPTDLARLAKSGNPELAQAIAAFIQLRESFLAKPFPGAISSHLTSLALSGESSESTLIQIESFLEAAAPIFPEIRRNHTFWLQTLLSELPTPSAQPPADRVIDVQGWLELLYEPGKHLIICGMNETFVPARSGGEPWLSENIRKALGLVSDENRHARDAYLLHAMLQMRAEAGSAHLICGKTGDGGETYLPSRLLFQIPRAELVPAVKNLFREIEPPEANLIWTRDFNWQTPSAENRERISVTALRDYLACPFRFYLKHIVRMGAPEPDRREMNARDFGSITHFVLECWGNDTEARELADTEKLAAYFDSKLNEVILENFGEKPPLAIRIQTGSIRQRLAWFAAQQAQIRADGWEITGIERKLAIPSNGFVISGMIDRIDRHRETGQLRVIDYKTGDVKDIEKEHRQKITARTTIPTHFPEDGPTFQSGQDAKGKPFDAFWKNLQLPLYALAEKIDSDGLLPIPAYIHLGKTADNVKMTTWDNFSEDDLESAKACADWITASIAERTFWPPAEKVTYDDFAILSQNAPLAEAFTNPVA
jgi:ATP-dependent helicase/nuclease subunit B